MYFCSYILNFNFVVNKNISGVIENYVETFFKVVKNTI